MDRIVVTVLGKDKTGIVAAISSELAKHRANIVDLTSAKMQDMFVMLILADISGAKSSFATIQRAIEKRAKRIGVQAIVQHEALFKAMHRV